MEFKREEKQDVLDKIYRDFCLTLRTSWFEKHKNLELLEFCCRLTDWIENLPTHLSSEELERNLSCYVKTVEDNLLHFTSLPDEVGSLYKKQTVIIKNFMEGAFKK